MVWFDFRLLEETVQHSDCFKLYFEHESTLLIQAHYFLFVCGEYIDWLLIYFSTIKKKRVVWKVILSQGPFTRLFFLSFQLHLVEHLNISLKRGFWDCAVISCRKSARQSWKLRRKSNKMTLNLFLWVCIWCVYIYFFLSLSQMVVTPNLPNLICLEKISHSLWIDWIELTLSACFLLKQKEVGVFTRQMKVWGFFHQHHHSLLSTGFVSAVWLSVSFFSGFYPQG